MLFYVQHCKFQYFFWFTRFHAHEFQLTYYDDGKYEVVLMFDQQIPSHNEEEED